MAEPRFIEMHLTDESQLKLFAEETLTWVVHEGSAIPPDEDGTEYVIVTCTSMMIKDKMEALKVES
jgi:hypothetical protein